MDSDYVSWSPTDLGVLCTLVLLDVPKFAPVEESPKRNVAKGSFFLVDSKLIVFYFLLLFLFFFSRTMMLDI